MATVHHERPRIVRSDGTLDLFALAEAIHTLFDISTDTNTQMRGLNEQVTQEHTKFREDIGELKVFKAAVKEAEQFEAGVAHGRGSLLGRLDRTLVLLLAVASVALTFYNVVLK